MSKKQQRSKRIVLDKTSRKAVEEVRIIEYALDAFGIKARVLEIDTDEKSTLFSIDISHGVRVEEIERLSKNLAMRLRSKTGDVEIIAPIPGQERIGIRVPKHGL